MNKEARIEKALDTLAEICDMTEEQLQQERQYERRSAAEEILRHYREEAVFKDGINVNLTVNGAVPVRPMVRGEV